MSGESDASVVELLVTFGVPGALALLGVWLGKLWERRGGAASWRRDQRLTAYAQLLDTSHELWSQLLSSYGAAELTQEMVDEVNVFRMQLGRDLSRIHLLGPAGIASAAEAFFNANLALSDLVATRDLDDSTELGDTGPGMALQKAHDEYVAVAQRVPKRTSRSTSARHRPPTRRPRGVGRAHAGSASSAAAFASLGVANSPGIRS